MAAKKGKIRTIPPQKKGQKPITFHEGGLHESLGVPKSQKIPPSKMKAALAGNYGPKAAAQARFKKNVLKGRAAQGGAYEKYRPQGGGTPPILRGNEAKPRLMSPYEQAQYEADQAAWAARTAAMQQQMQTPVAPSTATAPGTMPGTQRIRLLQIAAAGFKPGATGAQRVRALQAMAALKGAPIPVGWALAKGGKVVKAKGAGGAVAQPVNPPVGNPPRAKLRNIPRTVKAAGFAKQAKMAKARQEKAAKALAANPAKVTQSFPGRMAKGGKVAKGRKR